MGRRFESCRKRQILLRMLKIRNYQINLDLPNLGEIFFCLGGFFLVSALPLSGIFFLISIIISSFKIYPRDNYKYLLFICSGLMIFSTLSFIFISDMEIIHKETILLDLFNWIPLFLLFIYSKPFLLYSNQRILFIKCVIAGSFPLILSCILQYWFKLYGPYETLNGLIVWFQKPISETGSLSGLFNNQNYAGIWMVMTWPFCLCEFKKSNKNLSIKFLLILVCIGFTSFIFLTDSRNALLGLLISTPIVLGSSSLIWYLPTLITGLSFLAIAVVPIFPESFQIIIKSIIPSRLYTLFPEIGFQYLRSYPRVNKWIAALDFIASKPIFGWGAASFPIIYKLKSGEWFGHSHNLPLELAFSYGIIPSCTIFFTYLLILYLAFKKIYKSEKKISK